MGWEKYKDIIHMEHPTSKKHARMAIADRAAQFSPFAALTGYEEAVRETGRLTEEKITLDESQKAELNHKLVYLLEQQKNHPEVEIVYFCQDERKAGGYYQTLCEAVKKIDQYEKKIYFINGAAIEFDRIVQIRRKPSEHILCEEREND